MLITVGSRAAQTIQQVEMLAVQPRVEVFLAPEGELSDGSVLTASASTLILRVSARPRGGEGDPRRVAERLAGNALRVLLARPVEAVVATGGDTAVALLERIGTPVLQVMGELLPGIPYCRLEFGGRRLWLVTKAGGFGTPETLIDIVRKLRSD